MLADLGTATVLIAFMAAVFAAASSLYGARTDQLAYTQAARNALYGILGLTTFACGLLIYLLWTNDFSVAYVANTTSTQTPKYLKVTALWGSQAGSLLFWNFLLSIFTAGAMRRQWHTKEARLLPYAIFIASLSQIFFLFISAIIENPFARTASVPLDGNGLNPLLRHWGMIIHPPLLYLGFVGFTIPFAFAMSALISGELDDHWIETTRRWTLTAWLFLSLGLILGGRWAYDVLGWGGYWGWDPVENASFMPWLAGTAFLHSVMIQEKRSMFKMWNMFLVILTYLLVILGTFAVRSGFVSSVHTFAQSSIGWYFFGFIAIMTILSGYWLLHRWNDLSTQNEVTSLLSREAAFLLNNFVILAITGAIFLGTYFPPISELFGPRMTVGPEWYEIVVGPLFAFLVLLMGVAPLTMWHRTSSKKLGQSVMMPAVVSAVLTIITYIAGARNIMAAIGLFVVFLSLILILLEYAKGVRARMKHGENAFIALRSLMARNRRRYGGYAIHLGVIIMAFGIIGIEFFQQETQRLMVTGESVDLGRYTVTFNGVTERPGPDDVLYREASVDLFVGNQLVKTIHPRTELYQRTGQPMTISGTRSTIQDDLYVILINWEGITADSATVRIYLNPLVNWVWAGGGVFILGTLIAAWPERQKARSKQAVSPRAALSGD